MTTQVRDAQNGFAGGINTVSDPIALQPNQIRSATNARINDYGAIEKRGGSVIVNGGTAGHVNLPYEVLNGAGFQKDDGTNYAYSYVVCTDGSFRYLRCATGNAIPNQTWQTGTGATFSTTATPTFCAFPDSTGATCIFIADGGKLVHWDGSTLVRETSGAAHSALYIKVHNSRIWGCGDSAYPSSIFYSQLNDGSSFGHGGGGQIVIRTYSEQKVVALASVGSSLLIFHTRGVSRLTGFGQDDITVQPEGVSSQTGTIAPYSVVEADGAAFFVSDRGAFVATEGSVIQLGTPATPDPLLPLVEDLTLTQLANIRGVLSRRTQEVWWFIPGKGVYTYHLVLKAWSGPWTGEYLNTRALWTCPVNDEAELFVFRADTDKTVRLCEYPDVDLDGCYWDTPGIQSDGTAIPMSVQLRRMYFGDDTQSKGLRYGYVTAQLAGSATLNVQWKTNEGTSTSSVQAESGGTWNQVVGGATVKWPPMPTTQVWSLGQLSNSYRVQMGKKGYWVDVTLSSSQANAPIISRWQMDGFILGRR